MSDAQFVGLGMSFFVLLFLMDRLPWLFWPTLALVYGGGAYVYFAHVL